MRRDFWISGWEKPDYRCCKECGRILLKNEECFHLKSDRVSVETFAIVANPTVRWADIPRRRYTPLRRAMQRAWEAAGNVGDVPPLPPASYDMRMGPARLYDMEEDGEDMDEGTENA